MIMLMMYTVKEPFDSKTFDKFPIILLIHSLFLFIQRLIYSKAFIFLKCLCFLQSPT